MLADVVRERRGEVLEFARNRLTELMPERTARGGNEYLPLLLDHVVADLDDPHVKADADPALVSSAIHHGRERQRLGVDIQFVVHDFGVICDAIAEIVKRAGVHVDGTDWQKLNRALDFGIAEAISGYDTVRHQEERKRSAAAVGSLAHELRNALGAASVGFEAVKRGRVGPNSRTAEIVTRNLKQAALLTANLVVESKVDAQLKLAAAPVTLRPIVEDVVASVPAVRNLTTEIEVPPQVVVVADKQMLISAVTNLVQNAVKFTRPGGKVTVRARESAGAIAIEVEDECGGLPPGIADNLFSPFVQGGIDRSGVGLGLSIVKKIMLAHGGTARVQDLPGRGCILELSFPAPAPQ
jgi:signal transduction histidine kinase